MVEIRCGEHHEAVDLAGKSVAQAREQYKPRFDIADKARASLNGKGIKRKQESEIVLNNNDELSFARRSRKPLLVGALLLALAITGGLFAYTYTTASIKLTPGAGYAEFATVEPTSANVTWPSMWMRWKGPVPTGDLFTIDPAASYTGDLVIKVYLTNVDYLVKGYHFLNMRLQLWDGAGGTGNNMTHWQSGSDVGHTWKLLSLENGVATFALKTYVATTTYYIYLDGGSFHTHPWRAFIDPSYVSPELYCEVTQAE